MALFACYPIPASAGVFSFLFESAKKTFFETESIQENAQTTTLLEAVSSPEPLARGGGDTTIVDDSALLPDSGPLGTLADIEDGAPTSDEISIYTVRKGDTLSGIARIFGVSVNTIVWANEITGPLKEGQNLVVLPISGVRYTVKAGDTLQKIAEKYKGNAEEIASFNGLSLVEKLEAGAVVIVPDGEIAVPQKPKAVATKKKTPTSVGGALIPGYYMRPIAGGVKTQGVHGYNGVDLASYVGAPVYAAADGKVIISRFGGWNGGYGNYVVVAHSNGTQTLYAHLATTAVPAGVTVAKGQVVGTLGNTGRSTGPHLHFEIRGAANPF